MKRFAVIAAAAVVLGLGIGLSYAAGSKVEALKERQKLMKSVGSHMKDAAQMLKGVKPYDPAKVKDDMKTVNGVPDKYVTLFPEGTDVDAVAKMPESCANNPGAKKGECLETEAKPVIWTDMDDFKKHANELKQKSAAAMDAAADQGKFKQAFGTLAKTCKGCHKKFRLEKD